MLELWGFMVRLGVSLWVLMLVYNFISAVFGINQLRRFYINILRTIYSLLGSKTRFGSDSRGNVEQVMASDNEGNGSFIRARSFGSFKHEFRLEDACSFIKDGLGAVVDDSVTKRFSTSEVEEWNFLTRTQMQVNLGLKMELLLYASIVFRFGLFFIVRLPIGITGLLWLVLTMLVLSVLTFFFPEAQWRRKVERYCSMVCCRLIASALSAVIYPHNLENRAKCGSVCVANHTTPIDIIMLAGDNCFTLVGQRHGGFTGLIQGACSMAQSHIWFERKMAKDRLMVSQRLKQHVSDENNNPILIFPEGTCINNTSVFMFKKGCFELGATIYPVVIKYRREFADPFWNSQEQNMLTYLFMLMTSWAIVCDVYYLEPTVMRPKETAIEFAQRVKANICSNGGLVDLPWDGMIKRPGNESYLGKMIEEERRAFSEVLEVSSSVGSPPQTESDSDSA